MNLKLSMAEGKTQIELTGKPYKLPFGGAMEFLSFSGTGTLTANDLVFSEYEAGVAGGNIAGNARLRWGSNWSLEGDLESRALDAGKVASLLVSSGRLDGKGTFAMRAATPDKLEAASGSKAISRCRRALWRRRSTRVLQSDSSSGGARSSGDERPGCL